MIDWLKYLKRLKKGEQLRLLIIFELIQRNKISSFDRKKIKGHKNLYRIRIGKFRIIYQQEENNNKIIDLDQRNENTYKNL